MSYLIVGGTGTLGTALIERIYQDDPEAEIAVFSREELKQKQIKEKHPRVKCRLGDVATYYDVERVIREVNPRTVFNLAAIKHVDIAEENPVYCMNVNYQGAVNVYKASARHDVDHLVFSSTDKAVLPINIYGASKMAAEKYYFHQNTTRNFPITSVFRWGNVLGSRGSVLQAFVKTLLNERKVYITDLSMTRFWIKIEDVAQFMFENYEAAHQSMATIPEMKAAKVIDLASAVARYLEIDEYEVVESGIRPGEKYHETLWSDHDSCMRSDTCEQYTDDELFELVSEVLNA